MNYADMLRAACYLYSKEPSQENFTHLRIALHRYEQAYSANPGNDLVSVQSSVGVHSLDDIGSR